MPGFELCDVSPTTAFECLPDIKMSSILFNPRQIFILFDYHTQRLILVGQGDVDIFPYQRVSELNEVV